MILINKNEKNRAKNNMTTDQIDFSGSTGGFNITPNNTNNYYSYVAPLQPFGFTFLDKNPEVYVLHKKNRKKVFKNGLENIVYLLNNDEFEIEIYNPSKITLGIKISLNDLPISQSLLVIKPGQRITLDRFIDSSNKLKFSSYLVENNNETKEVIKHNGGLKLEFYTEQLTINNTSNFYYSNQNVGLNNYGSGILNFNSEEPINVYCSNTSATINIPSDQIETGRIEKSENKSLQIFSNYYGSFSTLPCRTELIQLRPESQRPLEAKDLVKKCTNCKIKFGKETKLKKDWNFCSECGDEINPVIEDYFTILFDETYAYTTNHINFKSFENVYISEKLMVVKPFFENSIEIKKVINNKNKITNVYLTKHNEPIKDLKYLITVSDNDEIVISYEK